MANVFVFVPTNCHFWIYDSPHFSLLTRPLWTLHKELFILAGSSGLAVVYLVMCVNKGFVVVLTDDGMLLWIGVHVAVLLILTFVTCCLCQTLYLYYALPICRLFI